MQREWLGILHLLGQVQAGQREGGGDVNGAGSGSESEAAGQVYFGENGGNEKSAHAGMRLKGEGGGGGGAQYEGSGYGARDQAQVMVLACIVKAQVSLLMDINYGVLVVKVEQEDKLQVRSRLQRMQE